ncbi:conserved hypothetical protein [Pyrobaculum islandicum DSM 4184]|uniref:Uncharacterized protein n=1 Tax=Pyrobaculum islandicum (strain DSM 4184 / JCM 9189 / GEO3) TaxID=384616 RepID=A1RVB5_PYRIL|nr:hypothetical protein [Pyrobaculum islandicum]ABL88897.1 conserved hypothetical protein [Pyrobaculum islandicum DSM 4184]
MPSCISDKFAVCNPEVDKNKVLAVALELAKSLSISPYDLIGVVIAFGADPAEAKKVLATEISGHRRKPIATFLATYGKIYGYEKIEGELLKFYQGQRGSCICPVGPITPLEDGRYIVQRPGGIYICEGGGCKEVASEPLVVYEHPSGCMFYTPPLVLTDQPISAVTNALKQLKVSEPEVVARYLLPGLCRDLWGVYIP